MRLLEAALAEPELRLPRATALVDYHVQRNKVANLDFSPGEWNRAAFCVIGGVATTVYATNQRQPDDYRV